MKRNIGQRKQIKQERKEQTRSTAASAPEQPTTAAPLPLAAAPTRFSAVLKYDRATRLVSLTMIEPQEVNSELVNEGLLAMRDTLLRREGAYELMARQQPPAPAQTEPTKESKPNVTD